MTEHDIVSSLIYSLENGHEHSNHEKKHIKVGFTNNRRKTSRQPGKNNRDKTIETVRNACLIFTDDLEYDCGSDFSKNYEEWDGKASLNMLGWVL